MHKFEPHMDLRSNMRAEYTEDSVWPTFTDIMTVVLMIFMFTMVAVLLTNTDLARQLMAATAEKEESDKRLGESINTLQIMSARISTLEENIEKKKMEIILMEDSARVLEKGLEEKDLALARREEDLAAMHEAVAMSESRVAESLAKLKQAEKATLEQIATLQQAHRRQIAQMEEERNRTLQLLAKEADSRIKELDTRLEAALATLKDKEQAVVAMKNKEERLELALARQRRDYTTLEDKYNKLIGPARSSLDKTVVGVRYSKEGGQYVILFKDAGSEKYEPVTRKELHNRLDWLKSRIGDKLYVKVVIPEDSNLSYNEAWTFTNTILTKYDYYYQSK